MSQTSPSYRIEGKAAVITLDDGKANAVSFAVLDELSRMLAAATEEAEAQGVTGKDVTPFLLARIFELTDGKSLVANIALVRNNARLAADIAAALKALSTR